MEPEKTPNSESNLEKENQSWKHHNPGLQDVLQSYNHQDTWYWHKNRHSNPWNRIENLEMVPQMYGQLIFDKARKNIHGIKTVSSASGAGKTGQRHAEEGTWTTFLHHTQK